MAVLGFHIVISLVALTVMSKLGARLSIVQLYIVKGLFRFIAPSNDEIRALMPSSKENPRARRKKRDTISFLNSTEGHSFTPRSSACSGGSSEGSDEGESAETLANKDLLSTSVLFKNEIVSLVRIYFVLQKRFIHTGAFLSSRVREEENSEGFNVPKSLPLRLRVGRVIEDELQSLPLYSSVHWLSLFVPLCILVYVLSEVFIFLFPSNSDANTSVLWLIIAVSFVLQVLARLTSWLVINEDERSVLFVFAAVFFLFSVIFATQADNFFDIHLLAGYDRFCSNIATLMTETGVSEYSITYQKDPILLYVTMSVLFSFIAAMLVFPNFRYANMYTKAQATASRLSRLGLHITFLLPLLTLLSFAGPVKKQLVFGPRKLLTEGQLDILRIYLVLATFLFRAAFRTLHLQAHLDLSAAKLNALQRETGYIRNVVLQATVFRYYSYFCAVILQYFSPVLLSFFFALLLKTTGDLSWLGVEVQGFTPPVTSGTFRSIFDRTVCRAVWSFSLVFVTFSNVVLSLIGVMYNSYFLPL